MKLTELKPYLDTLTYDKYYQDINCIGFTGYSNSNKTWEAIKDEVNWKNKLVADFGCFHGYFSFHIAKRGAKVIGFEKSSTVLETTDIINELEDNIIGTKEWKDGDPLHGKFDVALYLNVLHHFNDPDAALKEIDCDIAVFEINAEMETLVEKYFVINKRIPSHRSNRIILIARKCHILQEKKFSENKIFVTGIFGSGKSDYARSYANCSELEYINFDTNFSYDKTKIESSEDKIFSLLKNNYIIDAIPFNVNTGTTKTFFKYARENDVRIVCCVCSDKKVWEQRLEDVKKHVVDITKYSNFCTFYYSILPIYSEFKIDYYDTFKNEYITKEQLYERINWVKLLLDFI